MKIIIIGGRYIYAKNEEFERLDNIYLNPESKNKVTAKSCDNMYFIGLDEEYGYQVFRYNLNSYENF